MKTYARVCAVLALCCAAAAAAAGEGFGTEDFALVREAVFEVILKKPPEGGTVYDKELDWQSVPYAVRTDEYHSIGTAFAVSETELATAFHVINLGYRSLVRSDYCVRDSDGNVYEVDEIRKGSNEKDFLIFTVKGRRFRDWFRFEREFRAGEQVYSIGNALGEGIVVRGGLVLGTVPEEEDGRWLLLKSSADGNPGNSGGPLVLPGGRVIALVTSLRDNILYSVPSSVILDTDDSELVFRRRYRSAHLVLSNSERFVFTCASPLPDDYRNIRERISAAYQQDYEEAMEKLFNRAPEYLSGGGNRYLLSATLSGASPEIDFVDKNDNNWKLSRLERKTYDLEGGGLLTSASVSGFNFYKITAPESGMARAFNTTPQAALDLILGHIRTERTLWGGDKYRILSFGEPFETGSYLDRLGRTWLTACWVIGFDDSVLLMHLLPAPSGPAVITTVQSSAQREAYEWDMRKTCDHTHIAYDGTFRDWKEFLSMTDLRPRFLDDFSFRWPGFRGGWNVSLSSFDFSLDIDDEVFPWSDKSELFLGPSYYSLDGRIHYGIRKFVLNKDSRGKDYVILFKNIAPDSRFGSQAAQNWQDLVDGKYPFDRKPVISQKDNSGSIGAIVEAARPHPDVRYTLYLSMENPGAEEDLAARLSAFRSGVRVRGE